MNIQQIESYLCGEASESEITALFQWIDAAPENKKEFIQYKKVWALTSRAGEEEEVWDRLFAPRFRKQKLFQIYWRFARYAAMLLFAIGTGIAFQYAGWGLKQDKLIYAQNCFIAAPLGQMTNIVLPDGSKVMLNSGSSITYNGNFSKGERLVMLKGEAFFDVAKDQDHPFRIETSLLNFEVFGTSFNIEAYPDDPTINTTLVEGSLAISDKTHKELHRLKPGENASYEGWQTKLVVTNVSTGIYTSWKDGLITFRNEKLKEIAKKIERWYNVKIIINNPKIGEQAYFGTILKNKPIDQILEVLKLSSSMKYKIEYKPDKPTIIYWE
jgi:transmembrane sensor